MGPLGGKIGYCENFPLLSLFAALLFLCLQCAFLSLVLPVHASIHKYFSVLTTTVAGNAFYCHLITSEISNLFLSLGLDTGKVGIGGNQGASAPDRKQVRDVPMFVCVCVCV